MQLPNVKHRKPDWPLGRKLTVHTSMAVLRISYQELHQVTVLDRPLPVTAAGSNYNL